MASGLTRPLLDIEESSNMKGEPIIALELIERIVDCASADLPALCNLSIVCETFYRRCRTHMFSRLDFGSRSLQSLLKLLEMYTYKHNCRLRICLLSHVHYLQLPFKSVEYVNQLLRISPSLVNLRALEFYGSGITREDLLFFKAPTLRVLEALPKTTRCRLSDPDLKSTSVIVTIKNMDIPSRAAFRELVEGSGVFKIPGSAAYRRGSWSLFLLEDYPETSALNPSDLIDDALRHMSRECISALETLHCRQGYLGTISSWRTGLHNIRNLTLTRPLFSHGPRTVGPIPLDMFPKLAVLSFDYFGASGKVWDGDLQFYFDLILKTLTQSTPASALREIRLGDMHLQNTHQDLAMLNTLQIMLPAIHAALDDNRLFPRLDVVKINITTSPRFRHAIQDVFKSLVSTGKKKHNYEAKVVGLGLYLVDTGVPIETRAAIFCSIGIVTLFIILFATIYFMALEERSRSRKSIDA